MRTGNHQGLIVDALGTNIAVAYDKKDAPLIAAAPRMREELEGILEDCERLLNDESDIDQYDMAAAIARAAREALASAKGDAP